jgi:hypothetical protein
MEGQVSKISAARQRAEEKFAKAEQRDAEIRAIHRQRQDAEAAKLVRLRSLRLAKEATERVEAAVWLSNASAAAQRGKAASQAKRSKTTTGRTPR